MMGLLALMVTGIAALMGYHQSRAFVRRRLAFVDAIHAAYVPVAVGFTAALIALPAAAVLPLVGSGTAALFGVGVGMGVSAGARDVRRRLSPGG
jgi:hypothetical protein